jgi:hypothetical protein
MTRDDFWSIIGSPLPSDDISTHVENIQATLSQQPPEDIVDFERHMASLLVSSYTWTLWGAAYLINGGCSDDGFDYFRGWLIAHGQALFSTALANPDDLADIPTVEEDSECEMILYIARSAYEAVTSEEIPSVMIHLPDLGDGWDFDDDTEMAQRYPKLFARFCAHNTNDDDDKDTED